MTSFARIGQRCTAFAVAVALTTSAAVAFAQSAQPPPQAYPPQPQPYPPAPQPYPPQPQPYPPPPQYVYAPQPYPPPQDQYQYPATLPYEEGRPIPQGYHTRTTVRKGLIIGGAVSFGVLYALSLIAADADRQANQNGGRKLEALYVPAIGPFIATSKVESGSTSVLILDGLGQTAGLVMFICGFAFPKTELVRNDLGSVRVLPLMGKGQSGLSLVGTF